MEQVVFNADNSISIITLIIKNMETLDKKKMILEHNLRVFLKDEGFKEFEFRHLKPMEFLFRYMYVV